MNKLKVRQLSYETLRIRIKVIKTCKIYARTKNTVYFLTCATSPTTISPIWIWIASPLRITLNVCSPSIRSWRPRNCRSFDQSLNAVTTTTITTAIKMAAPSIQAWCSSSSGSSVTEIEKIRFRKWGNGNSI